MLNLASIIGVFRKPSPMDFDGEPVRRSSTQMRAPSDDGDKALIANGAQMQSSMRIESVRLTAAPPPMPRRAIRRPVIDATTAVKEFVAAMATVEPGGSLHFRRVRANYSTIGLANGWPALSDKALSQKLMIAGCSKRAAARSRPGKDGRRQTTIFFPWADTWAEAEHRRAA